MEQRCTYRCLFILCDEKSMEGNQGNFSMFSTCESLLFGGGHVINVHLLDC